jgi:hypothetical protein
MDVAGQGLAVGARQVEVVQRQGRDLQPLRLQQRGHDPDGRRLARALRAADPDHEGRPHGHGRDPGGQRRVQPLDLGGEVGGQALVAEEGVPASWIDAPLPVIPLPLDAWNSRTWPWAGR